MSHGAPGMATPHVLSVEHLTVAHEGETVIDDVSLRIDSGRVHGLLGEPGAGKTTLLDAIFGFVRAESGAMTLDGTQLQPEDVGYLPADLYFYPGITAREYLRTVCMILMHGLVFSTFRWTTLPMVALQTFSGNLEFLVCLPLRAPCCSWMSPPARLTSKPVSC